MQTEKIRVYVLARELNVQPSDILALCGRLGIDVKNQLSPLDAEQCVKIEEAVRGGSVDVQDPLVLAAIEVAKVVASLESLPRLKPVAPRSLPSKPPSMPPVIQRPKPPTQQAPPPASAPVILRPQPQYSPASNPGIEHLLSVGEKAGFDKLEKIASVATIDPECAMFKIRKLTERLCRLLLKPSLTDDLFESIKEIEKRKLLGRKAVSYLHQVRKLTNVAVHVSEDLFDDDFSMNDVNNAADGLASVIGEALSRELLVGK